MREFELKAFLLDQGGKLRTDRVKHFHWHIEMPWSSRAKNIYCSLLDDGYRIDARGAASEFLQRHIGKPTGETLNGQGNSPYDAWLIT